jgi:uncharacterized protein
VPDPADWIGKERTDPPGDIVCERGYILHWLEATENANPRFWDPNCDIALPSMLSIWMRPLQFVPGRDETWMPVSLHFDLKEAFDLPDGVVSANEITFHAPVKLGDRITTTQKIRDISDEKTTRVGTGRFWTIDVSYADQDGELKGVESYEMFSYKR